MQQEKESDAATLVMTLPHGATMHFNPHKVIHAGRFVRFTREGRVYTRFLWIFRTYMTIPDARTYLTKQS